MKNLFFLFGFLVLLLVFSIIFSASSKNSKQGQASPVPTKETKMQTLETKTDSQGEVIVEVTPKKIEAGIFEFEISMNTHSVALDEDMVAISKLIDDRGDEYSATAWEGDGPGGHHRSGLLKFESATSKPKSIKLIIDRIGGVERNFSWNL